MGKHIKCHFSGCENYSGMKGIHFYRFPKEEERCQVWVKAANNERLVGIPAPKLYERAYLCSAHFQDWCFMNVTLKHRLVHNAMPNCEKPARKEPVLEVVDLPDIASSSNATHHNSLLENLLLTSTPTQKPSSSLKDTSPMILTNNTSPNCSDTTYNVSRVQNSSCMAITTFSCSRSTQTYTYPVYTRRYTPRETELAKKIRNCKDRLRQLQSRYEACKKKIFKIDSLRVLLTSRGVDDKLATFIQQQVELSVRKAGGKRYSESDKMHAYQIYCASGAAYRALQGLLQLPSEHTLQRFISEKLSCTGRNTDATDVAADMKV